MVVGNVARLLPRLNAVVEKWLQPVAKVANPNPSPNPITRTLTRARTRTLTRTLTLTLTQDGEFMIKIALVLYAKSYRIIGQVGLS